MAEQMATKHKPQQSVNNYMVNTTDAVSRPQTSKGQVQQLGEAVWPSGKAQTQKGSNERLFILTQTHSMLSKAVRR